MDTKTYIQRQLASVRGYVEAVMHGITDEQANWVPPGTLSPISAIFLHMVAGEDHFIQSYIQGKTYLWDVNQWGQRIGVPTPPEQGTRWDQFKTTHISLASVLEYQQEIQAATDNYLAALTSEELSRLANFAGSELPVAELLMVMVVHGASHAGEIAAIKGMQGIQGLPY